MKLALCIFWILCSLSGMAQFSIEGKLRTLRPVEIKVVDLEGKTIMSCHVINGQEFKTKSITLTPDLYTLHLGEYTESVILTNTTLSIRGFLDDRKPESSSLDFEGINTQTDYLVVEERFKNYRGDRLELLRELRESSDFNPIVYATLMYLCKDWIGLYYEPFKEALDFMPRELQGSLLQEALKKEVKDRKHFAIGAQAVDFTYVDPRGKNVSLSDFRGKLVLIDFWASWCGPCRREMKSLLPIYNELKGDDLEFISISLDNKEQNWRSMLEEEKLPWVMLWNKEGFTVGDAPNTIQKAYGFYGIPFIVLIDKNGKILARNLRGDKVREAIEEARQVR